MEAEIYGACILVLLNFVAFWLREAKKHRSWKKNGNAANKTHQIVKEEIMPAIQEFKDNLNKIDGRLIQTRTDLARVETKVENQKEKCTETVTRITNGMTEFNRELLRIARNEKE